MPMASMATQTQMGERIKEELGSLLGPYPAKQRMNASLLNFSVFRDRYTKPLVSGQRVICTFPPPLGSAPRAALLSPAIMLSTGSCTRFLALQRIRKSSFLVCLLQSGIPSLQNPLSLLAVLAEGRRAGRKACLSSRAS